MCYGQDRGSPPTSLTLIPTGGGRQGHMTQPVPSGNGPSTWLYSPHWSWLALFPPTSHPWIFMGFNHFHLTVRPLGFSSNHPPLLPDTFCSERLCSHPGLGPHHELWQSLPHLCPVLPHLCSALSISAQLCPVEHPILCCFGLSCRAGKYQVVRERCEAQCLSWEESSQRGKQLYSVPTTLPPPLRPLARALKPSF